MFRPNFDPLIGSWGIHNQNKKKAYTKLTDFFIRSTQRHLAAAGLWTDPQTAGEIVSFLSFRSAYLFFYKKRKNKKKTSHNLLPIFKQFKQPFSIGKKIQNV